MNASQIRLALIGAAPDTISYPVIAGRLHRASVTTRLGLFDRALKELYDHPGQHR